MQIWQKSEYLKTFFKTVDAETNESETATTSENNCSPYRRGVHIS